MRRKGKSWHLTSESSLFESAIPCVFNGRFTPPELTRTN
jgi:hypothetical protein